MQQYSYKLEIKSLADTGIISGYCSVFNITDYHNDLIKPGAFSESIKKHLENEQIKLLWQHQTDQPIGIIKTLIEDDHGLHIKAQLLLEVKKAKEAYALIKSGAINGLSIGFSIEKFYHQQNLRIITKVCLWEVSLVTFPANNQAKIINFKQQQYKEKNMENIQEHPDQHQIANENLLEHVRKVDHQLHLQQKRINQLEATISRPNIMVENKMLDQQQADLLDFLRFGKTKMISDFHHKALSTTSNQEGGYLVSTQLAKNLSKLIMEKSIIRQLAATEVISSDSLDIIEDLEYLGAGWVGEIEKREDTSTINITKKKILVHELYAQPKASQKLIDDASIDIEKWLFSKLVEVFSLKENESFFHGDGIGKPRGILTYEAGESWGKIQHISTNLGQKINGDSLIKLYHALGENYLAKAAFIVSRSALEEITMLKDKVSGRYLWHPALSEKMPATLLGIPIYVSSQMPEVKSGATPIVLADFGSGYKIVDRVGLKIMRDPFTEKPFVKFYATKRLGGDVVNFHAIKLLQIA